MNETVSDAESSVVPAHPQVNAAAMTDASQQRITMNLPARSAHIPSGTSGGGRR
jgi:hypothetical protein